MRLIITFLLSWITFQAFSQYTFFEPAGSFAIEASLSSTKLKRLPAYRNAITSLIVERDVILGGTSAANGLSPFVFTASLSSREMTDISDIGTLAGNQHSIVSGFAKSVDGKYFAGTIAGKGLEGKLLEVDITGQGKLQITVHPSPVKNEGVFSLLADKSGKILYGISYPSGLFFSYNVSTRATKIYSDIKPAISDIRILHSEYDRKPEHYLTKALVQADNGMIYGSAAINRLFYFDPQNEKFTFLKKEIPDVWGARTLGQIESWVKSKDGKLYGGNAGSGQLIMIDPTTGIVKNLGKPTTMHRLRGLGFGRDGKLYGITGGAPGYSHLFSYDEVEGFVDLGNPQFPMKPEGLEQTIAWRGFQLSAMAVSADGRFIVMGEDETLSQLLVFETGAN